MRLLHTLMKLGFADVACPPGTRIVPYMCVSVRTGEWIRHYMPAIEAGERTLGEVEKSLPYYPQMNCGGFWAVEVDCPDGGWWLPMDGYWEKVEC